jgi:hypothetical protein
MVEGRLDTGPDTALTALSVGAIVRLNDSVQMMVSARSLVPLREEKDPIFQSDLVLRIGNQKDHDIRLISRFEDDNITGRTTEYGLTYSWHF